MAGKNELRAMRVGTRVGKQIQNGLKHVRMQVILEFVDDGQTTDIQNLKQAGEQYECALGAARLKGKRQTGLGISVAMLTERDPNRSRGILRSGAGYFSQLYAR